MNVKYIALTISVLSFAIGFSDLQENMFFWLGRPVGAIAFIVFYIFMVLEKESDLLDKQESSEAGGSHGQQARATQSFSSKNQRTPAPTSASSH